MPHIVKMKTALALTLGLVMISGASPAYAYMGAGAGLSAIGSALSFVGVLLLMVVGFVWYPVKRMLRRSRTESAPEDAASE